MNEPLVIGILCLTGLIIVLGVLYLYVLINLDKCSNLGVDPVSEEMKRRQLSLVKKWNKGESNDPPTV